MIEVREGNLLDVDKGIIVHGCNARGVMGSGIAAQIRNKWGKTYDIYVQQYAYHGLQVGNIVPVYINRELIVVDAITQHTYGRDSFRYVSYDAIADCFALINKLAYRRGIKDIHFPLIGAGLGGGNWDIIASIIDTEIDDYHNKILWELPKVS